MYLILLAISVIITILAFAFYPTGPWFSVLTSIGCGGTASVVVAWLVDASNCRQANAKTIADRETLLKDLTFVFEHGLQGLILMAEDVLHDDALRKWYDWIVCAHDLAKTSPKRIRIYNQLLIDFYDDVSDQIVRIQGQEAVLLKEGILNKQDIQALSSMLSVCDLSRKDFSSLESDLECADHLRKYSGVLRGLVDFGPSLRFINDKMVEPTLYKMSLRIEQESTELQADSDDIGHHHPAIKMPDS